MRTVQIYRKAGIFAIAIACFLNACNSGQNSGKTKNNTQHKKVNKEKVVKEVIKYPIPTSFEVTRMLQKAGASYVISISNPVNNVDKYFSEKERALNLGIYGADLAYASTYEMQQETMNYLKASKKLIDNLEVNNQFNIGFAKRIEDNIANKDSLIEIISTSFYNTYQYLQNNGKDNLSLLVMTGSFVEGLYLTSQLAIVAGDPSKFHKIIANQKEPLEKLLGLLKNVKEEEAIAEIYTELSSLQVVYNNVERELSKEKLKEITDKVSSIREKMI